MRRGLDRLDSFLGRLFFRTLGLVCAVVALACGYGAWWQLTHWNPDHSLVVTIMFGIAALGSVVAVPYCLSGDRRFTEVLDAMEGDADVAPPRSRR